MDRCHSRSLKHAQQHRCGPFFSANDDKFPIGISKSVLTRCMDSYGWVSSYASRIHESYRQFLELKCVMEDWEGTLLIPSRPVELLWKQHMETNYDGYEKLCRDIGGGRVLDYVPSSDFDLSAQLIRMDRTKTALKARYGAKVDSEIWEYTIINDDNNNDDGSDSTHAMQHDGGSSHAELAAATLQDPSHPDVLLPVHNNTTHRARAAAPIADPRPIPCVSASEHWDKQLSEDTIQSETPKVTPESRSSRTKAVRSRRKQSKAERLKQAATAATDETNTENNSRSVAKNNGSLRIRISAPSKGLPVKSNKTSGKPRRITDTPRMLQKKLQSLKPAPVEEVEEVRRKLNAKGSSSPIAATHDSSAARGNEISQEKPRLKIRLSTKSANKSSPASSDSPVATAKGEEGKGNSNDSRDSPNAEPNSSRRQRRNRSVPLRYREDIGEVRIRHRLLNDPAIPKDAYKDVVVVSRESTTDTTKQSEEETESASSNNAQMVPDGSSDDGLRLVSPIRKRRQEAVRKRTFHRVENLDDEGNPAEYLVI